MNLLKRFYFNTCSLIPMQLVKTIGQSTTLFPYQHTVSTETLPHIKHLYQYKNEAQFIKDLDFLLKNYTPVSTADIIKSVKEESKLPARSFLLSFDDGFREVYDIIAPILEKKGIPAVYFINPAFIDNAELFYRCKISLLIDELLKNADKKKYLLPFFEVLKIENKSLQNIIHTLKKINQSNAYLLDFLADRIDISFELFLQKQQPFLNSAQLQSLHNRGFSVGAHSLTHPYFHLLSLQEQVYQTTSSCMYVNQLLGTKDCCFSFPHSDRLLSQELLSELNKMDIPLFFGIQNQKIEMYNKTLHRFNAERPEYKLDVVVKGIAVMMWLRSLAGKDIVIRK